MNKLDMKTVSVAQGNIEKIRQLFPDAVTEVKKDGKTELAIDFDVLKQELSESLIDEGKERYQMTWPGKRQAVVLANTSTTDTLRPCKEESVDFDNTKNLYIEGDNLKVLKLLRETYLGKVKMIYIDPPYNTGNDFVYEDDFTIKSDEWGEKSGDYDEEGNRLVKNVESNGRFHTDWLNMIYPRLRLARDLLTDDGVIFISIDDNEQANLKKICDEVFGESNFISNLIWKSKSGGANDSRYFAVDHEYILAYAKSSEKFILKVDKEATVTTSYNRRDEFGEFALDRLDKQSIRYSESLDYEIIGPDGKSYYPKHKDPKHPNATWRWSKETVAQNYDKLVFENGCVYTKNYKKDGAIARSLLLEDRFGRTRTGKTDCYSLFNKDLFSNPKPYKLVRYLAMIASDNDSIILDFFSGSATTAHAVMQLNAKDGGKRKFIMVQLPEKCDEKSEAYKAGYKNICEIGKERIRRAGTKIVEEQAHLLNAVKSGAFEKGKPFAQFTNSESAKATQAEIRKTLDVGFRVLKLDSSNMQDVYYNPAAVSQTLLDATIDNIKPDRTPLDLLFQVMLELGVPLSAKIEANVVNGKTYYAVNGNDIIACFDDDIDEEVITAIAKQQPLYVVFKDQSFASDSVAINNEQLFKTYSPATEIKVI